MHQGGRMQQGERVHEEKRRGQVEPASRSAFRHRGSLLEKVKKTTAAGAELVRAGDFDIDKKSGKGNRPDYVTTVDCALQATMVIELIESSPDHVTKPLHFVMEEDPTLHPGISEYLCQGLITVGDEQSFYTLDGVDGTRQLVKLSESPSRTEGKWYITTMAAGVWRWNVITAAIGNLMSREVVGFDVDGPLLWIAADEKKRVLTTSFKSERLNEQLFLVKRPLQEYSSRAQWLFQEARSNGKGLCHQWEHAPGSIGAHIMRCAQGEAAGILLAARDEEYHDLAPVMGILEKAGFVIIHLLPRFFNGRTVVTESFELPRERVARFPERLIIHKTFLPQLKSWLHYVR